MTILQPQPADQLAHVNMQMAELCQRVLEALKKSPFVPTADLRFEAEEGHVVLRGAVRTYFQKQMAQEALRRVEGVRQVDNQLHVDWAEAPANSKTAH